MICIFFKGLFLILHDCSIFMISQESRIFPIIRKSQGSGPAPAKLPSSAGSHLQPWQFLIIAPSHDDYLRASKSTLLPQTIRTLTLNDTMELGQLRSHIQLLMYLRIQKPKSLGVLGIRVRLSVYDWQRGWWLVCASQCRQHASTPASQMCLNLVFRCSFRWALATLCILGWMGCCPPRHCIGGGGGKSATTAAVPQPRRSLCVYQLSF